MIDYKDMPIEHIVVDGSNIATEGRSLPSLKQLEEAVAELRRDHPNAEITVIVDATFAHRIDPSELPRFELAAMRGEYVHPPAGAIGRGDAFLLRVAEKVDGTVLSNDSFQEFHGEHPWLFERGRLLGATPVPGIGWIFSPRQPVRGPKSHQAVRETEQAKKRVTKAIAVATKEVVEPTGKPQGEKASGGASRRRAERGAKAAEKVAANPRERDKPTPLAVNDPLAFISFIAEHRLGEQLEGEVEGYTSHGAVVLVGEMRCYIPLANLGDPAPRSAREVLKRHQRGEFVLTALDPQRRGAELALPGIAYVSGHPREETVAAEVRLAKSPRKAEAVTASKALEPAGKRAATKAASAKASRSRASAKAAPERGAKARTVGTRVPVKQSGGRPAPDKQAPAKAAAPETSTSLQAAPPSVAKQKAASRRLTAQKAGAKTTAPRKAAAKKAPPRKLAAPSVMAVSTSRSTTAAKKSQTRKATTAKALPEQPAPAKAALAKAATKSRPAKTPAKKAAARKSGSSPTKGTARELATAPLPAMGRRSPRASAR